MVSRAHWRLKGPTGMLYGFRGGTQLQGPTWILYGPTWVLQWPTGVLQGPTEFGQGSLLYPFYSTQIEHFFLTKIARGYPKITENSDFYFVC